ncbi:RDD family protein [Pedobacter polaris]|uniref:RDD family protein n=1 Tax=Pedobacter polaris TaxID=2571273 RepID=A0A4U1CG80_9SPHI|nr:RDD family protein [Pedobacter polaris]TKC05415.1 RDD family protein [Pedobacter polaris]
MEEKYPSLVTRLQSTLIDTILIIVLMLIFSNVLDRFPNVPDWLRIILFALVFIIYEPVCTCLGSTLGNYVKGIRVRRNEDTSKRISIFQAIIRYPIKFALGWISFLTIHTNLQKRAIHDLAAGSVMIELT